jgi:hypothetical protein
MARPLPETPSAGSRRCDSSRHRFNSSETSCSGRGWSKKRLAPTAFSGCGSFWRARRRTSPYGLQEPLSCVPDDEHGTTFEMVGMIRG